MMDTKTGPVTADEIREIMGPQGDDLLDGIAGLVAARIAALVAERHAALVAEVVRLSHERDLLWKDLGCEKERAQEWRQHHDDACQRDQAGQAELAALRVEVERLRAWEGKARVAMGHYNLMELRDVLREVV